MFRALEIIDVLDGTTRVLKLVGNLDTNTSPQLDAVASRIYREDQLADVVIDLAECTFVSSAGLRVFVSMYKHSTVGGSLKFVNVSPSVLDTFKSSGFDRILTVE